MIQVILNENKKYKHLESFIFFFVGYHECGAVEVEVFSHKKFTYNMQTTEISVHTIPNKITDTFKMKFEENELVGTHYFFNPDMVTLL